MTTGSNESHGVQFFQSRDRRLLRKTGQLLDLARYGEDEKARVLSAVERELPTLREGTADGRCGT
jgi:hypothetical protein